MRRVFTASSIAAELVAAIALLALIAVPAAMAQTGGGAGSSGAASNSRQAPVGHRQPRADQLPSDKSSGDPNDPLSKENAALDRKIKSICRGC